MNIADYFVEFRVCLFVRFSSELGVVLHGYCFR